MRCPASTDPNTATAPVTSTSAVTRIALAASTAWRRGIAASVTRIMPVLYSLLITSTARIAITAWPDWTPVRLSFVVSTGHITPRGQRVAPTAAVLTAMASAAAPMSSQAGPDTVRSLVHSACSAYPSLVPPAHPWPVLPRAVSALPCSCVSPPEQDECKPERGGRPEAQHGEPGVRRQRVIAPHGRQDAGDLRVPRDALLDRQPGGRGQPEQPGADA